MVRTVVTRLRSRPCRSGRTVRSDSLSLNRRLDGPRRRGIVLPTNLKPPPPPPPAAAALNVTTRCLSTARRARAAVIINRRTRRRVPPGRRRRGPPRCSTAVPPGHVRPCSSCEMTSRTAARAVLLAGTRVADQTAPRDVVDIKASTRCASDVPPTSTFRRRLSASCRLRQRRLVLVVRDVLDRALAALTCRIYRPCSCLADAAAIADRRRPTCVVHLLPFYSG